MSLVWRLVVPGAIVLATSMLASQGPDAGSAEPSALSVAEIISGGDAARGRYLVERVVMCAECHSRRDSRGNIVAATRYKGGPLPVRPAWANDWPLRAPRIAGLPGYSDQQALRLFTEGAIGRDGRQLRPPMPRFRMTPEDAADVIAFIRSL